MKENGKMTFNMGKGMKLGLMAVNMKESTNKDKNMVMVHTIGLMEHHIVEIGAKIK